MKAKNYFLPAGDPKGSGSVHVFGGTARRSHRPQQVLLFRQRGEHAPADDGRNRVVEFGRERSSQSSDDGDARGEFRRHEHRDLRSADWRCQRLGPSAVCLCELSASRRLPIRDSTPATTSRRTASARSRRTSSASWLRRHCRDFSPTTTRLTSTTRTTESTTGRSRGCRTTGLPSTAGSATRQATRTAHPRLPYVDRWHRHEWPDPSAGAHLGFDGPQSLVGDHQHRVPDVGRRRRVRLYAHGHAGYAAYG